MNNITDKLNLFAQLLEREQIQQLHTNGVGCQANIDNSKVTVIPGRKYAKVDVGTSGKFMVEVATGNIFGIKAYGQIHKGHFYGTLDTINDYFWGEYYPVKKVNPTPLMWPSVTTVPQLTFAPEVKA